MSYGISNNTPFTMPVAPACGNSGFGGGFGDNGAWWLIILIVLFGWGGNGYGRGYGGGQLGDNYALISDNATLERKIDGVYSGICDSTYALNNAITGGFAAAQSTMTQGFAGLNTALVTQGYETRNAVTQDTIANMQGFNGLQAAVKDCCCTTQQNIGDVKYTIGSTGAMLDRSVADGFCKTNFNNATNTRDIIESQTSGTRAILDKLCAMETDRLREKLESERDARYALQGQLDRAQLRTDIVNDVRPCPKPAYITCNPFGCNCQNGYNYGYGTTIA